MSRGSSAAQKAFLLLDQLAQAQEPTSLAELSTNSALPKPSVHRLLLQLEEIGLVRRDLDGKRFLLGERATRFAVHTLQAAAKMPATQIILQRLVAEVSESCNIGILDHTEVVYIARVECNWPLRLHLTTGSRVPLHCTAAGKLLLAYLPDKKRQQLLRNLPLEHYTEHTFTDPQLLERELQSIRAQGIAINNQEYIVGLVGVGVPVLDANDNIIAGLAMHAPEARLTVDQTQEYVAPLRRAATELSFGLG